MRKYLINLVICSLSLLVSSCASMEGTRSKSYTYKSSGSHGDISTLAILPIEETSNYPMLPDMLEQQISNKIRLKFPNIKLIGSNEFNYKLHNNHKLEEFSSWYASYKATKYIDFDRLNAVTSATSAEYILSIRALNVDREKIRAVDTGYSGYVSNANNVMRTNLKFIGELIDLKQGDIIWQGIGYAENINSPRKDIDVFFVTFNQKNPEVEKYLGELVSVAAEGFVGEMMKTKK